MVLLCLAPEDYISQVCEGKKTRLNSPVRRIPFLTPLLAHYFPQQHSQLEEKIINQRTRGRWPRADIDFCNELRPYLEQNELLTVLEAREFTDVQTDEPTPPLPAIRTDEPLQETLLYVTTFFPELAPQEFDQVVSCLLSQKTATIKIKSQVRNKAGEVETIETEGQKPLIDFWSEDPDTYLNQCTLEAVPGPNGTTIIEFADAAVRTAVRSALRVQFEKRHSLYLMRQFQAVHQHQLLFNSTPAVTKNVIMLTVDMAIAHPDSYGKSWLFEMLRSPANSADAGLDDWSASSYLRHRRVTELLREMLVKPQLGEMVDSLLKDLMAAGAHDSVLYIVRGLQFAPRFDEFPWIKRLLDEAEDFERLKTYYHLYGYIRKIGIYPLLGRL